MKLSFSSPQLNNFPANLTIPSLPSFNKLDQKRLEVRRQGLQAYLKEVTSNRFIRNHPKAVSHLILFLTEGQYTRSKNEITRMVGLYSTYDEPSLYRFSMLWMWLYCTVPEQALPRVLARFLMYGGEIMSEIYIGYY